jgi:hypothetical protein
VVRGCEQNLPLPDESELISSCEPEICSLCGCTVQQYPKIAVNLEGSLLRGVVFTQPTQRGLQKNGHNRELRTD